MGEPMKCSQCNGTGQSFAQDDCFAERGLVICWQCGGTGRVWPVVGGESVVLWEKQENAAKWLASIHWDGPMRLIVQPFGQSRGHGEGE